MSGLRPAADDDPGDDSEAHHLRATIRYSPKCVEYEFCELRLYSVLRSWSMGDATCG
jgi:hypothetical protein